MRMQDAYLITLITIELVSMSFVRDEEYLKTSFSIEIRKFTFEMTLFIIAVFARPDVMNVPSTLILCD